jgi:hypothetical protein
MSEKAMQSTENSDVIRKLVVPSNSQVESKENDRSPTKTERDLATEVLAEADTATPGEVEVVRELVIPEQQSEREDSKAMF